MKVIFFTRGADTRFVLPATRTCVFFCGGRWRTAVLRCATTYAVALLEHGWQRQPVEVVER